MAATTIVELNRSDYGAVELKEWIKKYTLRAFLITMGILILFLIAFLIFSKVSDESGIKLKMAPIAKMKLEDIIMEDMSDELAPPPPTQTVINTGPASRAGTPVPVPEADLKEDLKEFAAMDELSRASAEGGDGVDLGGFASNIDFDQTEVKVEVREEEPAPDEFIPVEKEPVVDLAKLQQKIEYPDLARRAGIEGKVIVRVLVGKNGKAKKSFVEYSDSELLNKSAINAIKAYGTFTPAIQNGQPVTCWVSIPITFTLR